MPMTAISIATKYNMDKGTFSIGLSGLPTNHVFTPVAIIEMHKALDEFAREDLIDAEKSEKLSLSEFVAEIKEELNFQTLGGMEETS